MQRRGYRFTICGAALAAGVACADAAGPVTVASVVVDPTNVTLLVGPGGGQSRLLVAQARDADGRVVSGRAVSWSSADQQVVTISPSGLVTAAGVGRTTVRATIDGRTADATIDVASVPVHSVTAAPASVALLRGPSFQGTFEVTVTARDSAGNPLSDRVAAFLVSDEAVATVSAQGMLRAEDLGNTELIVVVDGVQDTVAVSVEERPDSWLQLSAGGAHMCGIASDNALYCWGTSTHGQLGLGATVMTTRPERVGGVLRFQAVSVGFRHSCAITLAGAAYCWGENSEGKLGDGTIDQRTTPTPVAGGISFVRIAVSASRSCGVSADGSAYCWGSGGGGTADSVLIRDRWTPTLVAYGRPFAQLALGEAHACALDAAGAAWCWGNDDFGQLGNGADPWSQYPVAVSGGHAFTRLIGGGSYTTCGSKADGSLWCWGWDPRDEFGVVFIDALVEPTQVAGATAFTHAAIGSGHPVLCVVLATPAPSGGLSCLGDNDMGQLGDGSTTFRSTLGVVDGTSGARIAVVGPYHACVVGPRALCWGLNATGALGDGTVTARLTPSVVRARWQ